MCYTVESQSNETIGAAHAVVRAGLCRFITENIVPTEELTGSRISNPFAGIAIESFMSWSAPRELRAVSDIEMIVFTNSNVGVLSDKTLFRDLAHAARDYFARDAAGTADRALMRTWWM
jgi:hypothetical protein